MDFNADTTILATYDSDSIIIYNIDVTARTRTVHQIIKFRHYYDENEQETEIKLSGDGLTIAYASFRQSLKRILVYQRSSIEDDFIATKEIAYPKDFL